MAKGECARGGGGQWLLRRGGWSLRSVCGLLPVVCCKKRITDQLIDDWCRQLDLFPGLETAMSRLFSCLGVFRMTPFFLSYIL